MVMKQVSPLLVETLILSCQLQQESQPHRLHAVPISPMMEVLRLPSVGYVGVLRNTPHRKVPTQQQEAEQVPSLRR